MIEHIVDLRHGRLEYERHTYHDAFGELLVERVTSGRLDGEPISDHELELLLGD